MWSQGVCQRERHRQGRLLIFSGLPRKVPPVKKSPPVKVPQRPSRPSHLCVKMEVSQTSCDLTCLWMMRDCHCGVRRIKGGCVDRTIEDIGRVVQNCHGQNGRKGKGCFQKRRNVEVWIDEWMRRRCSPQGARRGRSPEADWKGWLFANGRPRGRHWRKMTTMSRSDKRRLAAQHWSRKERAKCDSSFDEALDVLMGTKESAPSDGWVEASGSRLPEKMGRFGRPTVGRYPTPGECREQEKT